MFLVATFLVTLNTMAQQDRNVIWVHGLGGDASSWEHYSTLFDSERQINSLREGYYTANGITAAGNLVKTSMNVLGIDATNSQNLGIGHSMGGLMIRDIDRLTPINVKRFGGYITVATPNYGAPIANSLLDGDVTSAASNACNKLIAGPAAQLFGLPWTIVNNITNNDICGSFIDDDLIQGLQGSPVTNNDLRVGSATIDSINNYATNIPRISIWAEENSPVHWRLISSTISNNDTEWISIANDARSVYNSHYANNFALAIAHAFIDPVGAALFSYRATEWKKGRDWIDDSETIWSSLIKTTRTEQETYWEEIWEPCPYPPNYPPPPAANPNGNNAIALKSVDPDCGEWVWQELTRYVTVNYPSDGFLPKYTQIMVDNPTPDNVFHVLGANHTEVRNMSNSTLNGQPNDATKDRFDEIFNRPEPDFFHTD